MSTQESSLSSEPRPRKSDFGLMTAKAVSVLGLVGGIATFIAYEDSDHRARKIINDNITSLRGELLKKTLASTTKENHAQVLRVVEEVIACGNEPEKTTIACLGRIHIPVSTANSN